MRGKYAFVLVLLACMSLAQGQERADEPAEARSILNALTAELKTARIQRVELFFMSYDIETRTAVTPQMLEGQPNQKFTFGISATTPEGLVRAIENVKLYKTRGGADLRWGLVFWDRSGNRVHSVYLNGPYAFGNGTRGYIDGILVGFNTSLIDWLESNYLN
jgi:hypothetical protein